MPKWVKSTVLDDGINVIKNTCTKMHLISAYTLADSDAVVLANALNAAVTMASTDFTVAASGNNRTLTVAAGKTSTANATATGTPDLHIAFMTAANVVLWVTDETSNQAITSGNPLTFPGPVYTSNQPT
jgi:predicted membrane-bound mannosyltransferase